MYVYRIQCNWLQEAGSCISQPVMMYYNLFHFPTPVEIRVGQEMVTTQPNACILSGPREPRYFYFADDTRMNWMHLDKQTAVLLEEYKIPLNCVFYPENPGFIAAHFKKIREEFYSADPYREAMLDSYTHTFFIKLSRSIHGNTVGGALSDAEREKFRNLRWQIQSNPEKEWTVADMAKQVLLSPSRFHTVYKAMFGISPVADLINSRIDNAKAMLLMDEETPISDIAERLGYKNPYHFIRQFRTVAGVSPGSYRKNNR